MKRRPASYAEPNHRAGLSLLEVVIATVILAASLAVLGQLLGGARKASARAALETQAVITAQSEIDTAVAAIIAGLTLEEAEDSGDGWSIRRAVEAADFGLTDADSLARLTVHVTHENEQGGRDCRVTLQRLVFVPPDPTSVVQP